MPPSVPPSVPLHDPTESPGSAPTQKVTRHRVVVVAAVLLSSAAGWVVYDRWIKTDPGIAACERMASGKPPVDVGDTPGAAEDKYRQIRGTFQESRHEDIRAAGTRMVDVVWQAQQVGGADSVAASVAFGGQASEAWLAISAACANHGIVVRLGGR